MRTPESDHTHTVRASLRLRRLAFFVSVAAVLVMSLAPVGIDLPTTGWDKTNHLAGFAVLAILGCRAYARHTATVLTALLAYGALIEVLQSFTSYRMAEWGDLLADALGIVSGWGVLHLGLAAARVASRGATSIGRDR